MLSFIQYRPNFYRLDLLCSLSSGTDLILFFNLANYRFPFSNFSFPFPRYEPLGQTETERNGQSKEMIPPYLCCYPLAVPFRSPSPALSSIIKPLVHFDYLH